LVVKELKIVYEGRLERFFPRGVIQKYAAKCTQTRSTQNVGLSKWPNFDEKKKESRKMIPYLRAEEPLEGSELSKL
jgi:hypothetical protein